MHMQRDYKYYSVDKTRGDCFEHKAFVGNRKRMRGIIHLSFR